MNRMVIIRQGNKVEMPPDEAMIWIAATLKPTAVMATIMIGV